MTGIHNLKRTKVMQTLQRMGWEVAREGARHTVIKNPGRPGVSVPIPRHKVIAPGTIRAILKEIRVSLEEFLAVYNS